MRSKRRYRRSCRVAALMAVVLTLVACSGEQNEPADTSPQNGDVTEPDEELEPVLIRWQFDHAPPPHPNAVAAEWFKEEIERKIPGSEVRLFYAGTLFSSNPDALEAASLGNVEMVNGQYAKDAPFEPTASIVNQPAALTTVGAIANLYETEHFTLLRERMAARGVTTLANASVSFYVGYAGKCPHPTTPSDLRGLNIRTFDTVTQPGILGKWGANAIAMAWADTPSALETGVIDGVLTSIAGMHAVAEIAPCYTTFGVGAFGQDPYAYHASSMWLDSLNDATRTVVVETAQEAARMSLQFTWCDDQETIEQFLTEDPNEHGLMIHSPEVTAQFFGAEILGDDVRIAIENAVDAEARDLVASWFEEAQALSAAHPPGSTDIEQADCGPIRELAARLTSQAD